MRYSVKSAPPPSGDRNEFIMSDAKADRMGDVIEADGWQLQNFKAHPIALFNHDPNQVIGTWTDVKVQDKQLRGRLEFAEQGTSALVDTVRALHSQGILRAVSVGFRPIESKPLDADADKYFGPFRFLKSELLECSLVAVPANPRALNAVKSLGITGDMLAEVFRKDAGHTLRPAPNAKPGKNDLMPTGNPMKTLSERIQDAQSRANEYRDLLTALANKEERDDTEEAQYLELPGRIERQDASLVALQAAERALGSQRLTVSPGSIGAPAIVGRAQQFERKCNPGDHIVRAMAAHLLARVHQKPIEDVLRTYYPGDEGTGIILRAAVAPAQTTVAGWAAELVNIAVADFLNQLPIIAMYPRIAAKGPRFTFGQYGVIKIPARSATPTINGSFVGEGQPIPVRKLGLGSISLTPKKMGVISEFTREMALHSLPSIEGVVRQAINDDTAVAIDTVLIDANPATTVRPAGLLNGISGLTPSAAASRIDKIIADVSALMAPIIAARGGRDLVLLCNPAQKLAMSWAVTPNGQFIFQDGELASRGLTVVSSTSMPATQLVMIDAADFASVTGDTPEFDVSDVATIHEEDTTPLPIVTGAQGSGVVASPTRSLWQTASIGIRMLLDMNWTMRRTGMVSWMTGVTW
jgi:HK97 family phage prohead protease